MNHYNSYRSYLATRFRAPVLKIPVNGGFSCPNRDGTKSGTGCLFCDNRSFSPVAHCSAELPIEQLRVPAAKPRSSGKPLLPYLQPFSNTYAPVDQLQSVYEPLLGFPGVIGLAIGTRPDCFSDDTYRYLADLSRRTYLSIEIGLQSSHDSTLSLCNRGHTFADFTAAIKRLAALEIETVAHVILGLPGEDTAMMFATARRLAALPVNGIKIHQLMIIAGTEFEQWYAGGNLSVYSIEAYAEAVSGFIERLRPDQHIHRIVADATIENGLVAPRWSADKTGSLNLIHRYMDEHSVRQGRLTPP